MINIFSNFKIIFYFFNICLIFIYLFPGSLPGFLFYGDKKIQPQNMYDEKLLMQKVNVLTNKILKILKKDAIIDIKIKVNELN